MTVIVSVIQIMTVILSNNLLVILCCIYNKKRCHTFTGGQRKLQYKIQIQLNEIFFYANRMLYTIP